MSGREAFDYIVVGAGSAGCILANRFSRDCRVLLLEAGGRDWNPMISVPLMTRLLYHMPSINWGYDTVPQAHLGGRTVHWPRGKVLGGSSSINGMVYARGHRDDYDAWAAKGLEGWSYDAVLPYFLRSEAHSDKGAPYHGKEGPLRVTTPPATGPLAQAFLAACEEAGLPATDDFNGDRQEGFGRHDYAIFRGRRQNTARAFLDPVRSRPTLKVRTRAHVTRIDVERGRAVGVTYVLPDGREEKVRADREVVLAGGAVNSPQLLLLSGIGPADSLRSLDIACNAELPGVGQNLHDHAGVYVVLDCTENVTFNRLIRPDRAVAATAAAWLFGVGPGALMQSQASAFARSRSELGKPDVQLTFMPGLPTQRLLQWGAWRENGFIIHVYQLRPESRGTLSLRSADPLEKPLIDPNYLAAAADVMALKAGLQVVRDVARQPALRRWTKAERLPGPDVAGDAELERWIRASASTSFHPVGTCAMGLRPENGAVVDAALRVHGVAGLRVADASVMPDITGGNTAAPTMMIAERAADLILAA